MGKKYTQMSREKKLEIAKWIVSHQHLPVKQMAVELSLNIKTVYDIIQDYLDVRKNYTLKSSLEHSEGCLSTPPDK